MMHENEIKPEKHKLKKAIIVAVILVLLLVTAVVAVWMYKRSEVHKGMDILNVLESYLSEEQISMELAIQARIGDEELQTNASIYSSMLSEHRVSWIEQQGIRLYFADNRLILENGRAYKLGEAGTMEASIPAQVLALCRITQIAYSEVGQIQIYSISVEGDSTDKLLAALAPQMAEALQAVQEISVDIKVMDGRLSEITFKSDFLDGILAVKDSVKTDFVIPQAVQYSVKEGVLTSDRELAKDVIRIYRAWGELNNRRFLKTDIRIKADCNTIAFDEELALYRVSEANEDISRIQTGDLAITFTEDGIVGLENVTGGLTSNLPAKFDSNTVMGISGLIGLAYQMCLNGELSCREMGEHYEYSIALNETAMRDIALAILPEIDKMNIKLEAGSMQLTVEDDRLEALSIDCSGRAKVLLLELDIYLGADLNFEANPDEEDMQIQKELSEILQERLSDIR